MSAAAADLMMDTGVSGQVGRGCACAAGREGGEVRAQAAVPDRRAVWSWPLLVLAAPAAVAVWSGWVGIGRMTGFGQVHPLPGIWDSLRIDTAVTLPVGVEAYAAYALRAWLARSRQLTRRTRRFAGWSAAGSLLLGMAGQVAYHLLAQAGATRAPWEITTAVSCLPVLVLGMGAALAHLLRADACGSSQDPVPESAPGSRADGLLSGACRLAEAEAVARQLAAAGQGISRRALRRAGLHGSNADLGALAAMIRARPSAGQVPAGNDVAKAQADGPDAGSTSAIRHDRSTRRAAGPRARFRYGSNDLSGRHRWPRRPTGPTRIAAARRA
jgi:hypothetical protein